MLIGIQKCIYFLIAILCVLQVKTISLKMSSCVLLVRNGIYIYRDIYILKPACRYVRADRIVNYDGPWKLSLLYLLCVPQHLTSFGAKELFGEDLVWRILWILPKNDDSRLYEIKYIGLKRKPISLKHH